MMRIYKEFTFEAGLFLPSGPAGDPNARLHGNSFVVRVTVEGEPQPGHRAYCAFRCAFGQARRAQG